MLDVFSNLKSHDIKALLAGNVRDPFTLLGPHRVDKVTEIRSFQPGALAVRVIGTFETVELQQIEQSGIFTGRLAIDLTLAAQKNGVPYKLQIVWPNTDGNDGIHTVQETADPYAFGPLLGELDLHLIAEGRHRELGHCLGAQHMQINGIDGTRFAVWAPNARRVSVVGDFNSWDGRRHANASAYFIRRMGDFHSRHHQWYPL